MTQTHGVVEWIDALREDGTDTAASYAGQPAGRAKKAFIVHLSNSEVGHLDLSKPHAALWRSVLHSLHENQMPAYVEIDKRTKQITQLLQPKLQPVGGIHPLDQGPDLRIELVNSHALHVLRRKHPQFKSFLEILRDALRKEMPVWVTETLDTHEIIDVRPTARTGSGKRKSPKA
jgi:hypothetical protein